MNLSKRRWLLGSVVLALLLTAAGSQRFWNSPPRHRVELRESLLHLFEEAGRREAQALQKGDFQSAEVYLHGLLSLGESLDLARDAYQVTDLPHLAPERIVLAYDNARRLAQDPASRTRLWNLEERYDDQLRALLLAHGSPR